ncbi:MAG: hypothetical protein ACLFUW_08395 [Bacteroidales bacterium]
MNKKFILYLFLIAFVITACRKSNQNEYGDDFDVPDSVMNKGLHEISDEAMKNITDNISSPIETAALIKKLNVPFSRDYLATTDHVDKYDTNLKQALALGFFGADLGYLNMYSKTSIAVDYLSSIRKLANKIRVGQFFNFQTLKRLATNNENIDSLIYISQRNFNQMDQYLRENNRTHLSTLMVAGVWLEGLYLSCRVYEKSPDPELREAIGEQKIMISDLMILLENFERNPDFANLTEGYYELYELFKQVKISVEQGESTSEVVDGKLVIVQNTTSNVEVSDELLEKIIDKTIDLRNTLINP